MPSLLWRLLGVLSVEQRRWLLGPPFEVASTLLQVTTRVGVTSGSGNELSAAELLSRADGALYEAKRRGRNRYVLS